MTYNALNPSSNENIMAAVSHFFGFLVALFIWILQKDRSRFVRFQALQAMAFDVLISIIMLLITSCMVILVITLMSLGIGNIALFGSQNNPTAEPIRVMISLMQGVPFLATSIIFLSGTAFFTARLIATIQTYQGKDFHYPWLSSLIEQALKR